jgi:hypothetical protein
LFKKRKTTMKRKRILPGLLVLLALAVVAGGGRAGAQQSTAFTYQGQLQDGGTNAGGVYTMIFKLYDAANSGSQIGGSLTNNLSLANGLFAVNLDFGAGVFDGRARWLEITVTNGGATQTLSPRVQVLPTPYAQFAAVAATVTNGAIMNAQLAGNAVNANNIAGGQVVKSLNGLADAILLSAGANVTLTTNGNGLQISAATAGGAGGTNKLAAGNNVGLFTNGGFVQVSSFVPNVQIFKSITNATFTVPANATRIMVEMWGAGAGGGTSSSFFSGGGGGAGAYAMNIFTVTPGSSFLVTVGGPTAGGQAGAASSFGALMNAGGGSPGVNGTASANGAGGAGGTASGGLINLTGDTTGDGSGGAIWRGGSGASLGGFARSGPGGGGGGGVAPGTSGFTNPGGGGNSGLVIVYY